MTANDFRKLALALPESTENAHMDHPDFRVGGKIFATLGHPAAGWGMVKLTPEQQHYFSKDEPEVFVPVKGDAPTTVRSRTAAACSAAGLRISAKFSTSAFPDGIRVWRVA